MTWRLITALEQLHFPAELRVTMLFHILLAYSLFAIGLAAPFANYTRCENSYSASDIQAIEAQYIQDLQAAEAAGEIHRDDALAPTLTVPSLLCRTVKVVGTSFTSLPLFKRAICPTRLSGIRSRP